MTNNEKPQSRWIDRHFFTVVPLLAILSLFSAIETHDSNTYRTVTATLLVCGAFASALWASYLRKRQIPLWFLLGFIPVLPLIYLLGWHRAYHKAKLDFSPTPKDCPRCSAVMPKSGVCKNCGWHQTPA